MDIIIYKLQAKYANRIVPVLSVIYIGQETSLLFVVYTSLRTHPLAVLRV